MAKLTYGLKGDKLYHVDDVEQGLKCDCYCPNCKEKLIARQGEINEHHFAHVAKECDITRAQESALHYMAKEILAEYKIIKLPAIKIHSKTAFLQRKEYKEIDPRINKGLLCYEYSSGTEQVMEFTNVYLEQKEENIIPDLNCDEKLFIEIAITNFIGETKRNKIIEVGVPTIEIDLSEYKDKIETMTKRRLADILIDDIELKKWIYHPDCEVTESEIIKGNTNILNKQKNKIDMYCDMFKPEAYMLYQYTYHDTRHAMNFWRKQQISAIMDMPWFVGIPIYGDFIFEVDRRIWQSFVINLLYRNTFKSTPHSMWKYFKTKPFLKINPDFLEPMWISNEYKFSGLDVLRQYYEFLQMHNIINEDGMMIYGK